MKKKVAMLQWKETQQEISDAHGRKGKKFKYSQSWSQTPINSEKFRNQNHLNPKMSIRSKLLTAREPLKVGLS